MIHPTQSSSATDLLSALPAKFDEARKSGQLFFYESSAEDIQSGGRRFNIRCCPALNNKSKAKEDETRYANGNSTSTSSNDEPETKKQKIDEGVNGDDQSTSSSSNGDKQNVKEPFKPPYVEELYVGSLEGIENEEGMSILLNKYSLLPEHILLCPPTYQPQSLPPTPHQLALAYQILLSAYKHPSKSRKMLAFYNGGKGAGASQTWRHLQFIDYPSSSPSSHAELPLEEWTREVQFNSGGGGGRNNQPQLHPGFDYCHFIFQIPYQAKSFWPISKENSSELVDMLAEGMMKCLDLCIDSVRRSNGSRDGGWNLLMTLDHIHLIPRTSPAFPLPQPHKPLELNSLGYAGLMLVRSQEEEDALMSSVNTTNGLMKVLESCGLDRKWGEDALKAVDAIHGSGEWA